MRKKNHNRRRMNLILPVYPLLLAAMFLLPLYSVRGYSLFAHTTSHLGAQQSPHAWIMNAVFILLGAACLVESLASLRGYPIHRILLGAFGAGLVLVAVFRHKPLAETVPYSLLGDSMHSVFATVVGISFTGLAFAAVFVEKGRVRKALAFFAGLASVAFSLLMLGVPGWTGLWQRALFILSFAWLFYFLEGRKAEEPKKDP